MQPINLQDLRWPGDDIDSDVALTHSAMGQATGDAKYYCSATQGDALCRLPAIVSVKSTPTRGVKVMFSDIMNTPVGTLLIQASMQGITEVDFIDRDSSKVHRNPLTSRCKQQLQEYFEGKRKSFDLPLDLQGTSFQRSVWARLSNIPFGQAVSYRDIANLLSKPKAVRAVGAANGKNPIAIIVPCHRVIGADRTLTGYAGGLHRKAWLLEHEGIEFKSNPDDHQSGPQPNPQADLFE